MADPKSRARVERLIGGTFRPDDLMGLFLFARDHCDGRESVAEIGHFVAHHDERDKGIITRSTRDWFVVARYHCSIFGPNGPQPYDAQKLPSVARDYFKIAVNRMDAKMIAEKTRLRRAEAYKLMAEVVDRLIQNPDGTWALPRDLTSTEFKLVECISSVLVVKPAFEADQLFDDFVATLKSNGLIMKEELPAHRDDLRLLVELYAIAAMHNCTVQIGDGTTTQLKARPEPTIKKININAAVPEAFPGKPGVFVACSIFTANVDPTIYCHPDLLANPNWDCEIEVSPDKRLSPLGWASMQQPGRP